MSVEAGGASDRIRGRDAPRRLPRGEAVLPYLALALFVLMFVAGPLADIGVLKRPLLGMVMLIVMLSGLFTLGVAGRIAPVVLALGLAVFGLQVATLLRPTGTVILLNAVAAGLFVLLLCVLLLRGAMRCVFHASWAPVPRDRGQQFHASWAGWRADAVMGSGAGFGVKGPG
jgi:hypothetical protein